MRISDWSSDVCSSDLRDPAWRMADPGGLIVRVLITGVNGFIGRNLVAHLGERADVSVLPATRQTSLDELHQLVRQTDFVFHLAGEIGRASCRERVCQYVYIWVVAVA